MFYITFGILAATHFPFSLSHTHTHTLFLSFKMPREQMSARQYQSTDSYSRRRPDKQGWRLAGCPRPLLMTLGPQAAERKSGQQINSCCDVGWATGQTAAQHPARVQGTWPWVNWQMPGLWVRLQSDVTPRPLGPQHTGHTHSIPCLPYVARRNVFQAPDQLSSHSPRLFRQFDLLLWKCNGSKDACTQEWAL